jgi:predicted 3-demethylubiquinone-9 3-methyltransferase (glyoxalase superfamily)
MQKITPFLWFDGKAEEAARFYTSVFKNSKIRDITPYGEAGPGPKGSVMSVTFELDGEEFIALNGGPQFNFWEKLSEGGGTHQCGWLHDRYGVSWQIVPTVLGKLLHDPNPEKSKRVMKAMLQMNKLDIQKLKTASEQQ